MIRRSAHDPTGASKRVGAFPPLSICKRCNNSECTCVKQTVRLYVHKYDENCNCSQCSFIAAGKSAASRRLNINIANYFARRGKRVPPGSFYIDNDDDDDDDDDELESKEETPAFVIKSTPINIPVRSPLAQQD